MKIVILDAYTENPGDLSWDGLGKLGDLTIYDRTSLTDEEEIRSRIGDAEIVLTNKTPVSRKVIESCPKLRFIAVMATGYNVVDCGCARERGIPVANVPAYGTAAVAQYAVALLLEVCCGIGLHSASVHRGDWERSRDFCYWENPVIELNGKTIGIIGFGRGGLVNEHDLADALNSGKVYGAAVDVVSAEPIKGDNPLLHAKNCFITPHISWTSKECRQRVMDCTEKNVRAFLDGAPVNVVNR